MSLPQVPGLDGPGLALMVGAAAIAGLVRGFAGFGSALVFIPFAGMVMSPFAAIATLASMDLVGSLPNVPRGWREGHPREIAFLAAGFVLLLPVGLALLTAVPTEVFRIGISVTALIALALLVAGWRHGWHPRAGGLVGVGALSGFLCGATGIAGVPVILVLMTGPRGAAHVRATLILYLALVDAGVLAALAIMGRLDPGGMVLGALLLIPFTLATVAGAAMFRPERERIYRRLANLIILGSALAGLPIWGG